MVRTALDLVVAELWNKTSNEELYNTYKIAAEIFTDEGDLMWFRAATVLDATFCWSVSGELTMDASKYLDSVLNAVGNYITWFHVRNNITDDDECYSIMDDIQLCLELLCLKAGGHASDHEQVKRISAIARSERPAFSTFEKTLVMLNLYDSSSVEDFDDFVTTQLKSLGWVS